MSDDSREGASEKNYLQEFIKFSFKTEKHFELFFNSRYRQHGFRQYKLLNAESLSLIRILVKDFYTVPQKHTKREIALIRN